MADDTHNRTDATLVALVRAGEREAFGPLLVRSYASVLRLCERLLGSTMEAQDVVQEAALQAFLGLDQLHDPARFGAWLHAIAANLSRMALRRRRTLSLDESGDGRAQIVLWTAKQSAPDEIAATREIHDAIIAALGELSPVNREVAIGFYLEGYSYNELATLLGVPVSTIKGRLFFGRKQLRRRLRPIANELWQIESKKERQMAEQQVIDVKVSAVIVSRGSGHRVVMLQESSGERIMPIWVGPFEADAISRVVEGQQRLRPMTHDLTIHLLKPLGGVVQRVVIHGLVENTFYAEVVLTHQEQEYRIDARPSDAIALAVRVGAPIVVARAVFDQVAAKHEALEQRHDQTLYTVLSAAAKAETREQIALLLGLRQDVEVVGQAASQEETLAKDTSHRPMIILLADDPPDLDGVAATEQLVAQHPNVRVVLLAPPGAEPDLRRAMRAGARDVLVRPFSADELYKALEVGATF